MPIYDSFMPWHFWQIASLPSQDRSMSETVTLPARLSSE